MAKPLIFLCLCISVAKNVAALECYVTDVMALRTIGVGAEPVRKDCKKHFDDLGLGEIAGNEFRCNTVTAETAKGHMYIQGCMTSKDTCRGVELRIRAVGRMRGRNIENINCTECATDNCNGGVDHTVVLKSNPDSFFEFRPEDDMTATYEPHYHYASGFSNEYIYLICFLVGMLAVVIVGGVAHFVRKNTSGPGYKVFV